VAGLSLALDPILLLYANFPMTETLCALLGAWSHQSHEDGSESYRIDR
jgi:hypothetical protein